MIQRVMQRTRSLRAAVLYGVIAIFALREVAHAVKPVPFSRAKKDAMKDWKEKPSDIKATGEFSAGAEWDGNTKQILGYWPVNIVFKTKMKGVTRLVNSTVMYVYNGGGWSFKTTTVGGSTIIGMPPLDESMVVLPTHEALIANAAGNEWRGLTKIKSVALAKPPGEVWSDLNKATIKVKIEFQALVGRTLVEAEEIREIYYSRESEDQKLVPPAMMPIGRVTVVSKVDLPLSQAEKTRNFVEQQWFDKWQKHRKAQPTGFKSTRDAATWIYKLLMSDMSDEELYWVLAQNLEPSNNWDVKKLVMNQYGEDKIQEVLKKRVDFRDRYPAEPKFVEQTTCHRCVMPPPDPRRTKFQPKEGNYAAQFDIPLAKDGGPMIMSLDIPIR